MNTKKHPRRQEAEWLQLLARKSVLDRILLQRVVEMIGNTSGQKGLMLNGAETGLALQLPLNGGTWESVHRDEKVADLMGAVYGERSRTLTGFPLPFADGAFDVIVVHDLLEHEEEPGTLVQECHRLLKATGRLVLCVPHAKQWAVARGLERLLGLRGAARLAAVHPLSAPRLFDLVKDGFDVEDDRTFGRFFLELGEATVEFIEAVSVKKLVQGVPASAEGLASVVLGRQYRVRSLCYPLLVLSRLLDGLLFFTKGYYLVSKSRRRIWRPRRAPKLTGGRSIADAAINTKIGTAGPF